MPQIREEPINIHICYFQEIIIPTRRFQFWILKRFTSNSLLVLLLFTEKLILEVIITSQNRVLQSHPRTTYTSGRS